MALWIIVVILLGSVSVFSKKRPNHFMAFTMHFIDLYHQSCKRHFCYLIFLAPIEIELGSTSQNWLRLGTDLGKDLGTMYMQNSIKRQHANIFSMKLSQKYHGTVAASR